jgi:hypothetical protein
MKAGLRTKRSRLVAAGTAGLMVLGAGAAYAYWSGLGEGTGTQANATGSASMTVTQNPISGLTPGGTRALSGKIINLAGPDASVGNVLATVTSVSGDTNAGAIADYWISGTAVVNANVPTGTSGIAWSGLTLHYANSANNQDSGKSAQVNIAYTLAAPGVIIGEGTITGATEYGNCYLTVPGDDGPIFAHSTFTKQFQLVKVAGGYDMNVVYGNGTFAGVAGAVSPGACGVGGPQATTNNGTTMSAGITGTLSGSWSAKITTDLIANPSPDCSANVCQGAQGFLTAAFGNASMQPSMTDYSWKVVYNAGPTHGSVTQIGTAGVLSGSGNIK